MGPEKLWQIFLGLGLHKYLGAAVINTSIGVLIVATFFKVLRNPFWTLLASACVGYAYSIATYHYLAFDGRGKQPPYKKYALVFGLALLINASLTSILMPYLHSFLSTQILIMPPVIVGQWAAAKFWVFNTSKQ